MTKQEILELLKDEEIKDALREILDSDVKQLELQVIDETPNEVDRSAS